MGSPVESESGTESTLRSESGGDPTSIDAGLVARARKGDPQAWARLYHRHFDGLFRHLRYLSGDPELAEELVQETFLQAMGTIARFEGRARFSTWLHGIGLNLARNRWRRDRTGQRVRGRFAHQEELRTVAPPDQRVLAEQRVELLNEALSRLPDHYRAAFVLRDLQELPPAEAAAQLGISTNNFKVRASRARARLREILLEMGAVDRDTGEAGS